MSDTGPPYPHATTGFDPWATVLSQYANSPSLTGIIMNFFSAVDLTTPLDDFYADVWDLETAIGFGLDIWGRILGVGRVLELADGEFLGFAQQSPTVLNFGFGIFYSGQGGLVSNYTMTDEEYRSALFAKAYANISDGSIKSINNILLTLFPGSGNSYVQSNGDMSLTLVFEFTPTNIQAAILTQLDILPLPAGVAVSYEWSTA